MGAGHVFFELERRDQQMENRRSYVLNDADEELVTFFRVLRNRRMQLARKLRLTPYSRSEFYKAQRQCGRVSDIERARRLFIRLRQGMGARQVGTPGWGIDRKNAGSKPATWRNTIDRLEAFAEPLRRAYLDCRDFERVIGQWDGPNVLFYADPPYVGCDKDYPVHFTAADQRRLADALSSCRGRAAVSNYEAPLTRQLYPTRRWKWHRRKVAVTSYLESHGRVRKTAVECLIVRRD